MDPNNNNARARADPEIMKFIKDVEDVSHKIGSAIPIGTDWPVAVCALRMTTKVFEQIMRSKISPQKIEEWDNFSRQSDIYLQQMVEEIGEELKK